MSGSGLAISRGLRVPGGSTHRGAGVGEQAIFQDSVRDIADACPCPFLAFARTVGESLVEEAMLTGNFFNC
jgi:hypothetical protein